MTPIVKPDRVDIDDAHDMDNVVLIEPVLEATCVQKEVNQDNHMFHLK